jgi:predicted HAD superfamily Cof-like phosphohydrolase
MHEAAPLNNVAAFHKTFKHPILNTPGIPDKKRCDLRVSLLLEEMKELQEAINQNDLVEVADALCDIQYVLAGAILEFGLGEKFKELFDEVHRSNMSKACASLAEANATIEQYKTKEQSDAYWKEEEALFLVYRAGDHKTLKSINYSPADLKSIL